jgi:thioredoxin reductase
LDGKVFLRLGGEGEGQISEDVYDVIIIGGGPAGATAAIYAARAELKTLVVDKGLRAGPWGWLVRSPTTPGCRANLGEPTS